VHAIAVGQLNAYDVLVNDAVVFTDAALRAFVSGPAKGSVAEPVEAPADAPADAVEEDDK
jgi:large subunit ribosomal protein L4